MSTVKSNKNPTIINSASIKPEKKLTADQMDKLRELRKVRRSKGKYPEVDKDPNFKYRWFNLKEERIRYVESIGWVKVNEVENFKGQGLYRIPKQVVDVLEKLKEEDNVTLEQTVMGKNLDHNLPQNGTTVSTSYE